MLQGWVVVLVALAYILLLFLVASYGDRAARLKGFSGAGRPLIYALSLSVYCTSWTFFGSVGLATRSGIEFLGIYIGPILMFFLGYPLLRRIIHLAKSERITSVADFIAARYGKSQMVAAMVTLIAVIGMTPYIALQLKALSLSVSTIVQNPIMATSVAPEYVFGDETLLIAIFMAVFTWLFGTRHTDATEHQEGLMLAIAMEAMVKLIAFLAVGIWATFVLFDGPGELLAKASEEGVKSALIFDSANLSNLLILTMLSLFAIVLLPRQFHVTVTENNSPDELRRASWLFPSYLIAINLFVIPIALAGMALFSSGVNPDMFVLALPRTFDAPLLTLVVFVGGLSAATAMVIVTTVALSIMVSNDLVMPLILRRRTEDEIIASSGEDMSQLILNIRRMSIFIIILGGYIYYRVAGDSAALASIGLLSFAAIAQFAPSFFGGLIWRRATARGAKAAMMGGFFLWFYTLLLPVFAKEGILNPELLETGLFGIAALRPEALFFTDISDPFIHGVLWSLGFNIFCYVAFSLSRQPTSIERLQANVFVPAEIHTPPALRLWRTAITTGDLQATIARYIGEERTQRSFDTYARDNGIELNEYQEADARLIRFSEQLLASAIGSASARLVLSLLFKRRDPNTKGTIKLLDDATEAIQYNRDLLQVALDQVRQGLAVFDRDLHLIFWNRNFREILSLPIEFGQVGVPLERILTYSAERGEFGDGVVADLVSDRLSNFIGAQDTYQERMMMSGNVLEVRTSPMPNGGLVITYSDITERVMAEDALAHANETLERRVRQRTAELTSVNDELMEARQKAELANQDKTRFLAAAGHDILQPLNAAKLYSSALSDKFATQNNPNSDLVRNVEASLESVEEIIGTVLEISRLDTATFQPEFSVFRLDDILKPLETQFRPIAEEKGLRLKVMPTDLTLHSDRRLMRRLLQNLISNAIKYTETGGVLVATRKRKPSLGIVEVFDTGLGIPEEQQKAVFKEFQRLDSGARIASGLGLGLSIVERISRVLDHKVSLTSKVGKGTRFSVQFKAAGNLPKVAASPAASKTAGQLDGLVVLAIDNEPKILEGMTTLLNTWNCTVIGAESGIAAAKNVHKTGKLPDIILADYHLDEGTGIEAIGQLRWKFGNDLPAILITADRSKDVRGEAEEKNILILNKPLKPAALRAHLARRKSELDEAAQETV
ncbi:PAS domain-containing hybrid sensor histidine kinase/response regulator [Pseudovibrio exalbescens]|uniref:PAS domain-containing hybrid sensor histidine kinase/response regulator n=1 Tax=Pseudovibrio exalbescens TaxID=197461 RepID=UPI0023662BFA|nr:PAS domain-containing hybrid sensor histidine kinase/response regulator [Pseudovibrio exalbescens]MDD7911110.1 PAS domain-containing hybrid sensor histidine kinase/response regulator [Pseudovibrio exalbescens]